MIEFAYVSSNDVVYDIGCGDGRVCHEALECLPSAWELKWSKTW